MRDDPAFGFSASPSLHDCSPGLTKREYFAAMALQGILACYPQWPLPEDTKRAAELAAAAADHLIAELDPYK